MDKWIIYAIASMFFAGVTSIIAKFGMKNVSADTALAVRTSMVFLLIWLNVFVFRRVSEFTSLTKNDVLFLCLSAVTTTLSWVFYYRAIRELVVNKLPRFSAVIFSLDKAKNAGITIVTASIFNAV